MGKKKRNGAGVTISEAFDALDQMEPDLHHLGGLMALLQILGEADDALDQTAIAALARCARKTADDIHSNWQTAIATLRPDRFQG